MYSDSRRKICAIIAAAGKGTRMGMPVNKQYLEVKGLPVLARTIEKFENSEMISEIVVVVNEAEIEFCRKQIVERFGFGKVKAVVAGGSTRQQSVYNGLMRIPDDCGIVLVHDGARPFIDERSIAACVEAAGEFGAAIVGVPVKDTIKRADTDGFVEETVERSSLWHVQTPQAFRYELFLNAHRRAVEDGYEGTDDAVLVERTGCKIKIVEGSYYNIKITTAEDLAIADAICCINGESEDNVNGQGDGT